MTILYLVLIVAYGYRVGIDEARAADNVVDAAAVQQVFVNRVEPRNIIIQALLETTPVVTTHCDLKAVVRGVLVMVGVTRRVPHDLLGHTAHVDAGAPKAPMLDYCDSCAVLCGTPGVCNTAAATTDNY